MNKYLASLLLILMSGCSTVVPVTVKFPDAPDRILNLLFTEARKFGLGMILASQMSDHFGSEVKANAASWLVLKPMDMKEAKRRRRV
jgi:hypothetical protein